ncbi:MAG: WbqC family protein, partial [Flavobacteriaceae bacterium]|nr:WbqC family protein [Flavobacteriaceae bacterium]
MNRILLHPSYFPSIAQMAVIAQSKHVVFEAEDNYQKQTYRNRAFIAHSNGKLLLNIPILHSKDGTKLKTREVNVENSFPWQYHHLKSIQTAYRSSPFYEYYEDEFQPLFTEKVGSLFEHNMKIYQLLSDLIEIEVSVSYSKEYMREPKEIDFRNLINAKAKLDITFPPYHQVLEENHGFLPNLSILDLLFNEGPNTITYLKELR